MALQSYLKIAILQHTARIFLGISGLLLYAANANTQTVSPLESDTPSDFRRIFVPANNPELWPQGDTRYLPIEREAFEALVSKSKKLDDTAQNSHAVISTARYSALLEENQLKGTAELGIEHRGGTKVLSLSPWNMVISSASWRAQTDIPVQLGIWGDTGARGTYGVKVEQSDELLLEWDLKAQRMNANSTVYRLHIPPTAQCTFELTLPHDATASMSSAVVVSKMNLALNRQRLTFQLTNADSHLLRITTTAESENTSLPPQISQDTTYRIEKKGTSVVTKIRLEDSNAAQKELRIQVPQDTHLTNVKIDGIKTAWTQSISPEGEVIAIVNRPLLQHPQSIELHAFARTLLDQSWLVPKLHFENVSWTQGSTILLIAPELELQSFSPSNAILEHIVGLNSPTGEAFRFQDLSGDSQIECLLGPSVPKLEIHSACSLSWKQSHIVAEQNTSLTTTQGSLFHLEFDISPNWKIESVESLSPAVIENWQIREEAGQKVLHIQLESPVTPNRATTLKIFGRAATDDFSFPTQAAKLSPVIFTSSELKQSYLQLPQKQLSRKELVMESDLAGQEIANFDDSIAELFTDPTGQAYEIQHNSKEARVNLQKRHSSFKAEIYVEANAKESVLEQNFTVNIEPTAGIVSDVVLESTIPLPVGMAWSLINQSGDAINRVLMSSNHTSSDHGTYRYTLRLPNVQEEAFQLRGDTSIAIQTLNESTSCSLKMQNNGEVSFPYVAHTDVGKSPILIGYLR